MVEDVDDVGRSEDDVDVAVDGGGGGGGGDHDDDKTSLDVEPVHDVKNRIKTNKERWAYDVDEKTGGGRGVC